MIYILHWIFMRGRREREGLWENANVFYVNFCLWPLSVPFVLFCAVNWNFPHQSTALSCLHSVTLCYFLSYVLFPLCYLWLLYPSVPGGQSKSELTNMYGTYLTLTFRQSFTMNFLFPIFFFIKQARQPRWKLKFLLYFTWNCALM